MYQPQPQRLQYLDGLRGLLCLVVVYHHFLCGFEPCRVFGPSSEWIVDPSICKSNHDKSSITAQIFQVLAAPFSAGPFAVSTFFVMSGCALSINLLQESSSSGTSSISDKWRLAATKRFFRLAIPCFAAMVFAYVLGGFDFHTRAAQHTQSNWLKNYNMKRPATKNPILALVLQSLGGIWHGSATLNNAIWTMKIELLGSYLVFFIVALIKNIHSSRHRTQLLAGIALFLMVPSPSVTNSIEIRLGFQFVKDPIINGTVVLHPVKHSRLLKELHGQGKLNNLSYVSTELQTWTFIQQSEKESNIDTIPQSIDSPKMHKKVGGELASQLTKTDELLITSQELVQDVKWSSSNPYLWYVSFVAGVWIADQIKGEQHGGGGTPLSWKQYTGLSVIVYICAGYPLKHGGLRLESNFIWRAMSIASKVSSLDTYMIYYILGASVLVWLLVTCNAIRARHILTSRLLLYLGRISFSLYLTHIPILYTVSSAFYIRSINQGMGSTWSNNIILFLSMPFFLGVASVFEHYVDRPSIRLSNRIGRAILSMDSLQYDKRDCA